MPPPGNKAPPFKTMDIKTAFLSCGNRKRKASPSQVCNSEPKSLKLSVESSDHENDIEALNEACGIKETLESELDSSLGDCKENKDINAAKIESFVADCKENKQSPSKDELTCSVNVPSNELKLTSPKSPKSHAVSENDVDLLSEKLKISDNSSCDELNNSLNASLNTSGLSVTGEDDNDDKGVICSSKSNEGSDKDNEMSSNVAKESKKKRMTAAEAQKKSKDRELKQKERLLKRQELENKKRERLLEKERKIREKMLKKEREELERKERERIKQEKKEQEERDRLQRQKEKEEKLKLKQMLLDLKLEEKKRKEEMKLKREEELKRAEEEKLRAKLEKEQKEREKQERAKAAFAKFFVRGDANTSNTTTQAADKEGAFLPFQVSDDMILAPVVPPAAQERFNKKQLDHYLECQDGKELYLQILKSGSYKDVRQRKKNRKLGASEADVIVIDKNAQAEIDLCPKLLQFCENVRPPYWGTWRKKSKNIGPRKPFGQDEVFDYSVDSDDEWDEGGPGESLSGTEQEDMESEDEYEVDNEFFVPHGYLSDEEEKKEDDDEEVNDPEKQKALLKIKLQQFEMERKKKTTELKPIILGCCFLNDSAFQDNGLEMFLQTYSAELLSNSPIPTSFTPGIQQTDYSNNKSESPKSSNSTKKKKYLQVPEEAFPQLILLVHGSTKNRRILAEEFQKYWTEQSGENNEIKQEVDKPSTNPEVDSVKEISEELNETPSDPAQISLTQLRKTIREIASYGKPPDSSMFNKCCWWVHDDIREKYGLMDAPIPNQWKYVSQKEAELPAKVNCTSIKEFLSHN